MKIDHLGQFVFDDNDCIDLLMSGADIPNGLLVDSTVDINTVEDLLDKVPKFTTYDVDYFDQLTIEQFDKTNQSHWHMPDSYKNLDIAEYVLNLCKSSAELQRVGEELLLYQEKNLFDLLRYLVYLVDIMKQNKLIWGVGRGSSVASYVLYLIGVHRINSLYYNLDIREFLR